MSSKFIFSVSLLAFVLQACGDTPDEKKLKRRNDELSRQNQELTQKQEQTVAERDAAEAAKDATASEVARVKLELETSQQSLKNAKEEKAALEKAQSKLSADLAKQEKAVNDLNKQIDTKNEIIASKEAQISGLDQNLSSNSSDLERTRLELDQLKQERETLKTNLDKAQTAAKSVREELQLANKRIGELESEASSILANSLKDVRGLWLAEDKITAISDGSCFEFVHLTPTGSFAQAIACSDGRVQIQKHGFDRFSAQSVPMQTNNDFIGSYGFVVDGSLSTGTCADPAQSILIQSQRLIFEMTAQDFGDDSSFVASLNLLVPQNEKFKGFTNTAERYATNVLDYNTMRGIANLVDADEQDKAAAAFLGALEGQSANIRVGCFDKSGTFSINTLN